MKIVITPNPYRDKQFQCAVQARKILEECGVTVQMCLPFDVDKEYVLPDGSAFADLKTEIRDADILICFGGDGTILHASKIATARQIPVLGVNIGTMPCRMLSPLVDEISDENDGVKVGKINIDEQRELAAAFSVMKKLQNLKKPQLNWKGPIKSLKRPRRSNSMILI